MAEQSFALDLGNDHKLSWMVAGDPEGTRVGAIIDHPAAGNDHTPKGEPCAGSVAWADTVWEREHPDRKFNHARWLLESPAADEHLTISPSVLCSCGDHGFIRDGKWVPA